MITILKNIHKKQKIAKLLKSDLKTLNLWNKIKYFWYKKFEKQYVDVFQYQEIKALQHVKDGNIFLRDNNLV